MVVTMDFCRTLKLTSVQYSVHTKLVVCMMLLSGSI